MKRNLRLQLMLIVLGWWHNAYCQSSGSIQQYYYLQQEGVTFAPIASYQFNNKWYAEARYNYEDINTFSFYMGKTFENDAACTYSVTPIIGGVFGTYKGVSAGANIAVGYKKFNFESQPQYTFSARDITNNFLYSWNDISYQIKNWLAAGFSLQYNKLYQTKSTVEKGFMVETAYKNWSFPIYIFSPESKDRYFLIGVNFEWEGKKRKKIQQQPKPDLFDTTATLIAGSTEKDQLLKSMNVNTANNSVNAVSSVKFDVIKPNINPNAMYAVMIGPLNDKDNALQIQQKLHQENQQSALYTDGKSYKVMIPGFTGYTSAEKYLQENKASQQQLAISLIAYQIKHVDVYTVKN